MNRRVIRGQRARRGATLVETLIGFTLTALVAVGASAMMITVSKQTRVNFATEYARRQASTALDFMAAHLRRASADRPLSFAYANEVGPGTFDSVRFLESDGAGRWRWAEFRLGARGALIYDPDTAEADNEQIVVRGSETLPHVSDLRFLQCLDAMGVIDHTTLSFTLTVTDHAETRSWLGGAPAIDLTLSTSLTLRGRGA